MKNTALIRPFFRGQGTAAPEATLGDVARARRAGGMHERAVAPEAPFGDVAEKTARFAAVDLLGEVPATGARVASAPTQAAAGKLRRHTALTTTSRYVTAGDVRVHVLEHGAGEPVLFIHGVGGWAEHWQGTFPALARAGFKAIACDLPGFGLSAAPADVRYLDPPNPYYARFIQELLAALGLERVTLVGHSLGGAIAAVSAMCFPEIISRLVLVAPGGFGRALSPSLRLCGLPLFAQAARIAPERLFRRFVTSDWHDRERVPEWFYADALHYCRNGALAEFGRVMSQLVTLRGPKRSLQRAWRNRAGEIFCPTLIMWGRQDRTVPLSNATSFDGLGNAQREVVEDAGHLLMLEQPDLFQRSLLSFLSATPTADGEAEALMAS